MLCQDSSTPHGEHFERSSDNHHNLQTSLRQLRPPTHNGCPQISRRAPEAKAEFVSHIQLCRIVLTISLGDVMRFLLRVRCWELRQLNVSCLPEVLSILVS